MLLPKAKPRAMREHFFVSSIRSREVARAQRSGVRHCEDALKALDFGNSLLGVHSVSISNRTMGAGHRISGTAAHVAEERELSVSLPREGRFSS